MKKTPEILSIMILSFLVLFSAQVYAKAHPPQTGSKLPDFVLSTPEKPELKKYLGIAGITFTIPPDQINDYPGGNIQYVLSLLSERCSGC